MTGDITYNVSYDKGNGKTKASNIFNKGGEIKALEEIGMFHDPIGYSSTAAAEDKRALQLVKDLINKGVNKEDAIEKAAEKFKLRVDYLTRYVNKNIDEKLTKSSSVEDHIEDFKDSDAPQFKGKSLKKIKQMALASFLQKQGKKKVSEEFKVGQKVTYLGHPGEITKVNKEMTGATTYNVSYDKGTGKTKATNIFNKGGEIKAV